MQNLAIAPEFCLSDLNGILRCLGDYRGKIVLIIFWSAECPQSERMDKEIAAWLDAWSKQVVLLRIASNVNETLEQMQAAASERGLKTVLLDTHQEVADLYAAQATPHCFLVDGKGLLRYQGAFDDVSFRQRIASQVFLKTALEAVLDGREPDPVQTPPYGCTIVRHLPNSC